MSDTSENRPKRHISVALLAHVEEDVLQSILNRFVANDENYVNISNDIFPKYVIRNLTHYLDELKYKNLIANYVRTISYVQLYLTPDGINYFVNKKKQIFPKNSMDLLHQLLEQNNPVEYMGYLFEDLDCQSDNRLRAMMGDLKEKDYIVALWSGNIPYSIEFKEKAYTVDNEDAYEMKNGTYIFNNITNGNANINSTDNSVRNVNITNNEMEVFEKMLKVASNISEDDKNDIVMAITNMKNSCDKPSFKEKYYKFIEVAANHMTLFAPFIPLLTEIIK